MTTKNTPCALIDLNPRFLDYGGEGTTRRDGSTVEKRFGVMIRFDCPCGCDVPTSIHFENPIDGGDAIVSHDQAWHRTGETFETLTLHPSIRRRKFGEYGCDWHGWIELGQVRDA